MPKRQEGESTDSQTRHSQQSGGTRRQSAHEIYEQKQRHPNAEEYGERWCPTPGTILLPREWKDLFVSSQSNAQRNNELPPLQANDAGLCERRDTSTPPCYGEGSASTYNDARPVHVGGQRTTHSFDGQSQDNQSLSRQDKTATTRPATSDNSPGVS